MDHVRLNYTAGDPIRVRDVVKYLADDARPLVDKMPGNLGMSVMVNSALGVAVVQTYWKSDTARQESDKAIAPIRREMALRGTATVSVEFPEIVSYIQLIRPPAGAAVQLTRMQTAPSSVDAAIAGYEDTTVPWMAQTSGFCSELLLVDRKTGLMTSETIWRDADALAVSRTLAAEVRLEVTAATDTRIRALEEYSLLFSSIRNC